MARDRFVNPATGETYNWQVNHSDEEASGKTRSITRSALSSNLGAIRQQGDDGPLTLKLAGTILHRAQFVQFWRWYTVCRDQTIFFYDFDDQGYEVQITAFDPLRRRTLRNPRDDSAPYHYWTYSIEMDVYRALNGDLVAAGVTP